LNLLVIDDPSLTAGIVIGRSEPTTGMVLSVGAQPLPSRGIRILGGIGGGLVALSSAVLPGNAAGEPFTDPQHPLEMTNGCPTTFRA
jgi:hypothetical protein